MEVGAPSSVLSLLSLIHISTAATASVAGTDCNGIFSTVIQDAGIQCIYIIYIPRIGSVIEADTLIVKVNTVGTDEFSIDIRCV